MKNETLANTGSRVGTTVTQEAITREEKYCKVPALEGQTMTISAHGKKLTVRRTASRSWVSKIQGEKRVRFADYKKEVCGDISHFRETGSLPHAAGGWA